MTEHVQLESLSAYLDNEVDERQRGAIAEHLEGCDVCQRELQLLSTARQKVASLDQIAPTPQESHLIKTVILDYGRTHKRRAAHAPREVARWKRSPLWGLAGAAALIASIFAFANRPALDERQTAADTSSAGPSATFVAFSTPEEVQSVVASWPEVKQGVEKFQVSDVGTLQARQLEIVSAPRSDEATRKSEEGTSRVQVTELPIDAKYPAGSDKRCLKIVLESQRHPMMPLLVREASYRSKPAWLLVYVWSPQVEEKARLDRVQYWLVAPGDCRTLHYSSFTPRP